MGAARRDTVIAMHRGPNGGSRHHLGEGRRNRGPGPVYVAPTSAAPQTTIVQQSPAIVQATAPQVVYYQPTCVSPLIISIEQSQRHGRHHDRSLTSGSAEVVSGAGHSCMPERVTVRVGQARVVSTRY